MKHLEGLFGEAAATPVEYIEKDWTKDWIGGAYFSLHNPSASTYSTEEFIEKLRMPFGRIHFAGTETACQWWGYMEGNGCCYQH